MEFPWNRLCLTIPMTRLRPNHGHLSVCIPIGIEDERKPSIPAGLDRTLLIGPKSALEFPIRHGMLDDPLELSCQARAIHDAFPLLGRLRKSFLRGVELAHDDRMRHGFQRCEFLVVQRAAAALRGNEPGPIKRCASHGSPRSRPFWSVNTSVPILPLPSDTPNDLQQSPHVFRQLAPRRVRSRRPIRHSSECSGRRRGEIRRRS